MGISGGIELRHLRCLQVVGEELNFRRAAERLHMTQPPLSRTIAQLEGLLGARLLERDRSRCALTPHGERVHADVARLLGEFEQAMTHWRLPADGAESFRLGLFFALVPRHFPVIERALRAEQPMVSLEMSVDRTHVLLERLRKRKLDGALVMLPCDASGLNARPLAQTEMVALLPAGSALARSRRVRVRDLPRAGPVLFMREEDNPPLYAYLGEALRARGLRPSAWKAPKDMYAALADIAAGKACALVARTMRDRSRKDLAFRPLHAEDRLPVTLGLVTGPWVPPRLADSLAVAVRAYLGKLLESPAP